MTVGGLNPRMRRGVGAVPPMITSKRTRGVQRGSRPSGGGSEAAPPQPGLSLWTPTPGTSWLCPPEPEVSLWTSTPGRAGFKLPPSLGQPTARRIGVVLRTTEVSDASGRERRERNAGKKGTDTNKLLLGALAP